MNDQGHVPDELEAVDVTTQKPKEVEPEFVDVVGQISLRSLERAEKKKRHQQHHKEQPRQQQHPQQQQRRDNRPPIKKDDRRGPKNGK